MAYNKKTVDMMEHFKKEWVRDDVLIVVPKALKHKEEWDSINRGDIRVLYQKEHKFSTEWEIIVHKVFKFGVVLTKKNGYHIQQLQYTP